MIVRLQGGLGNQMFQYAYGRSRGAKFDKSGIVAPRTYALDPFRLPIEFSEDPATDIGYWQSEKWFDHALIRKEFHAPDYAIEYIAVHVRLTDNLSARALAFHGNLLDTDYYKKAMVYMRERVKDLRFLVFSDDAAWCQKNLNWPDVYIKSTYEPYADLLLMARCPYAIIANSSFSWWGAWLGAQKIVVAPKRWFVVEVPGAEDIVPARWIKL